MEARFNVVKEERKALVAAVSDITGLPSVYKGAPGFAFAVGEYIINKNGTLTCDEQADTTVVRALLTALAERGFVFEGDVDEIAPCVSGPIASAVSVQAVPDDPASAEPYEAADDNDSGRLSIDIPFAGFTATALENLEKLVVSKAWIIRKMTGANELPIERDGDVLQFPWFDTDSPPDKIAAYTQLVVRLCETAKQKQRVTASERQLKDGDNEKFKARCFLLSLNFIGDEYAQARKILLTPMSGSGSFKTGSQKKPSVGNGVTAADSGEEDACAVHVRDEAVNAATAPTNGANGAGNDADGAVCKDEVVSRRCGECNHHCYYTTGDLVGSDGSIIDTSRRVPVSYTHYCLNVPSGYRRLKHAVDWSGSETAPKWCPLCRVDSGECAASEAAESGAHRDCLACAGSLSESGADSEGFDRLFCVIKQSYVSDDGVCDEFND